MSSGRYFQGIAGAKPEAYVPETGGFDSHTVHQGLREKT